MSRSTFVGRVPAVRRLGAERERGQMLVIFALALTAMIGMVGLIIDGGDTFLQRRDQQNVADAAAMAAGYAWVNSYNVATAQAAAQTVAAANGYTNGVDGTIVTVTVGSTDIKVDVQRPHRNYFSGVMGMATWDVSTTASVQAGVPNVAYGAMPLIFNERAYKLEANRSGNPVSFSEPGPLDNPNPQPDNQFNWTVFCTASGNPCNLNTNTATDLINGVGNSTWVTIDEFIGPLNSGDHTALFSALTSKIDTVFAVAIVNDDGEVQGWANFHLTGTVGGSTKQISGWFDEDYNSADMYIDQSKPATSGTFAHVVKLTN